MPFSPLTHDRVFRYVFGEPEGFPLLKSLINAYFEIAKLPPVVSLELLNPDLGPLAVGEKRTVLDVLVQDERGRKINVEIQTTRKAAYYKRSLFHWARLYARQLVEGENYAALQPVVTINFLEYETSPDPRAIHQSRLPFTDNLVIFHVELPKLLHSDYRDLNFAEIWGKFLEQPGENLKEARELGPVLQAAQHRMEEYMALTPQVLGEIYREREQFDANTEKYFARQEGREEGRAEGVLVGKLEGRLEGRLEGKLEVAQLMLSRGMPADQVAELTGLAEEDLKA